MSKLTEAAAAEARAEAIFKEQQLLNEADNSLRAAEAEKTANLRALRLAKEAVEASPANRKP